MIYFDNAATYLVNNKDVYDVFNNTSKQYLGNTSSIHHLGYTSNNKLEEARKDIIKTLKLNNEYEIIFTSSATEGINFAIKGYCLKNKNRGNEIISFKNEHSSVINSLESLKEFGFKIIYINSNKNGEINYEELEKSINKNTIMVSIMSVNNEVGSLNDIKRIKDIVAKYPKCVFFSDVTQSIGKINLDYNLLDMFAFSSHKIGGIIGSGVFIKKKKILLNPLFSGGGQEFGYRGGTVSLPLAVSTSYILNKSIVNLNKHYNYVLSLKTYLINKLKEKFKDKIVINCENSSFPYILNFSLLKKKASVVIEALSNEGIYVSSLSACDSKKSQISYVLTNIGLDKQLAENSIRVSFSYENNKEEIDIFVDKLEKILEVIR